MKLFVITAVICIILLAFPMVSASHYIVGRVNNASDGTSPDGFTVVLWNPNNGYEDHISGIIGLNGNSGTSNMYLLDCSSLDTPCRNGDILNIKVIEDGGYKSKTASVVVSGAGFDFVEDILLEKTRKPKINKPIIKKIILTKAKMTAIQLHK